MGLYKRKNIWWMSFSWNRKQYQRSTGVSDRKTAERIYAKVQTMIVEGKWFDMDRARRYTFDDLVRKYLEYSQLHKSPRALANDRIYAKHLSSVFKGMTLDQITPDIIAQYRDERLKIRSPQTVKHELTFLNHALNLAVKEWDWIDHNPCLKVQKPRCNNQVLRWLTADEEEKLLKESEGYLNGQLKDIIILAIHTGMRQGEILNLRWKDVDIFRKTITIMQHKTMEPKTIPMNDIVSNMLVRKSRITAMSGYVFTTSRGTRILSTNLQREFWKVLKKAGIENFRFHDLRHTFATRLVQAGVDLYTVSKLLGHRDVKTSQRYAHHNVESVRLAVQKLIPRHGIQEGVFSGKL